MAKQLTVAAIGCSGHVAEVFVRGFLAEGVSLRLLARDAETLTRRYPDATIVRGSMLNPDDVARVTDGADAVFLLTPMARLDDPANEVEAARAVIDGVKAAGVKHLVYTSVVGAERKTGVGVLDAKFEVERLLASSGVPYTVLRCGSYMEDVFDPRREQLKKGTFLFPITKSRRISWTSQKDVAPFVVRELMGKGLVLNRAVDFVAPEALSVLDIERGMTQAAGRPVKAVPRFPALYLFTAALPYFRRRGHRFASIIPLIRYFDRHGSVASGETVGSLVPSFAMTSVQEHLDRLLRP